jgi:hypothetical protein
MVALCVAAFAAACSDDDASRQTGQARDPQMQRGQQPTLATTFNAVPSQSMPATGTTLQDPQPSSAQAQAASPSGASATDSVVLAPPVIHTVD